jgi:hypothetical protein
VCVYVFVCVCVCVCVLSLLTEADAGHTEFTDEVFQNETRFPGGEWAPASEPYTDVVGRPSYRECVIKYQPH